VHTDMQASSEIRRRVLVEGASKRSVCSEYGIGWRTLEKILSHPEPPGYRGGGACPKTKLGPYIGVISEILASDADAPPKQHHTAKGIFERLRDEYGYQGGITQVKDAVARHALTGCSGGKDVVREDHPLIVDRHGVEHELCRQSSGPGRGGSNS
jgi:hypothetical protein